MRAMKIVKTAPLTRAEQRKYEEAGKNCMIVAGFATLAILVCSLINEDLFIWIAIITTAALIHLGRDRLELTGEWKIMMHNSIAGFKEKESIKWFKRFFWIWAAIFVFMLLLGVALVSRGVAL